MRIRMAYSGIGGVRYARYDDDNDDIEPDHEQDNATVEELYFDKHTGMLVITFSAEGSFHDLQVPVLPKPSWTKFREKLPKWSE